MNVRKILFWTHLTAGSLAGIVILIMSFTGVLLGYQRQITAWVNRGYRSVAPYPGAAPLPVGEVVVQACRSADASPSAVTVHSNPALPVEVGFGRDRTVYFNSYTGAPLGMASQRARHFFQATEGWHRWLGVSIGHRAAGRDVTGICTLAFLVLVSSGIILWWPRSWSPQRLKAAVSWRWNPPASRARPWNWHTVTGFWCFVPLFVIVVCGVIMAFPWANDLLYRVAGSPPPAQTQQAPAAAPAGRRAVGGENGRDSSAAVARGASDERSGRGSARPDDPCGAWDAGRLDPLWDRAEQQVPGWQTIGWRASPRRDDPAVFSIDRGNGGRPDLRAQLTLDPASAGVVKWEPFASYSAGRRWRAWVRFSHTGEAGGLFGQTIAVLATTGTMVLVITGLTMAWGRFLRRLFGSAVRRERLGQPVDVSIGAEARGAVLTENLEAS